MNDTKAQPPRKLFDPIQNLRDALEIVESSSLAHTSAETSFIAILLVRPDWIGHYSTIVSSDMLHHHNPMIYRLILAHASLLERRRIPLCFTHEGLLSTALEIGGYERLLQSTAIEGQGKTLQLYFIRRNVMLSQSPAEVAASMANAVGAIVERYAASRAFRAVARAAIGIGTCTDATAAGNAISAAATEMMNVLATGGGTGGISQISGATQVDRMVGAAACPSFTPTLNYIGGGYSPGTLNLLVARTGAGKSQLLIAQAIDLAAQGYEVLLIDSDEMSASDQMPRILAHLTGLDSTMVRRIESGQLQPTDEEKEKLIAARAKLNKHPFRFARLDGRGLDHAAVLMRQFAGVTRGSKRIVLFDYLKASLVTGRAPEWQLLGEAAAMLKGVASTLALPLVCGVQSARSALAIGQSEYANGDAITTVGGSDRLAQNADTVMTLRPFKQEELIKVLEKFGAANHTATDLRDRVKFNAAIHVLKSRYSASCFSGIPFHIDYSTSRFREFGFAAAPDGSFLRDSGGGLMKTPELVYLESPAFARKVVAKTPPSASPPRTN